MSDKQEIEEVRISTTHELDDLKSNIAILLQTAGWFRDLVAAAVKVEVEKMPAPVIRFGPDQNAMDMAQRNIVTILGTYTCGTGDQDAVKIAAINAIASMNKVENVSLNNCSITAEKR